MVIKPKAMRLIPALFGLCGVALGAYAAHGIADTHVQTVLGQASLYLLIHAAVLLAITPAHGFFGRSAVFAITLGVLIFSAALMLRYLAGWDNAGSAAPFGGSVLMIGWGLLALSAWRR